MSKYTTEVRFICETEAGLQESKGYADVDDIITRAIPKIFNFNFPIFDENYRTVLERKILKHYYTREIGFETYGLWKLKLNTKLNEIMPLYNKLYNSELLEFNPLYTSDITRTRKTDYESERDTDNSSSTSSANTTNSSSESSGSTSSENSSTGSTTSSGTNLFSETPQGALNGLNENSYLTNATKTSDTGTSTASGTGSITSSDENSAETNSTGNVTSNGRGNDDLKSTEEWIETVKGFEGKDASEMLLKFRQTFLNIDMLIIEDLEELFMQLW